MRKLSLALLIAVAIPAMALTGLYLSDPLLVSRFISLFAEEDGSYENLTPRAKIRGARPVDLPLASAAEKTITADALTAMRRYAADQDSFALIVLHQGVIQTEWYADGWSQDSLTQSQSMHKSILPILIGAALRDGDIESLDDPVDRYLQEWREDPRGSITVRQMLQMSSGLLEYSFSLNPFSDAFQWLFASDSAAIQLDTPLDWEPGSKFEYNNVNSELLGLIIERATGSGYADYLQKKLWTPMGGERAELWLDSEAAGKVHSSCCLLTTARDWARFGLLLLGRGTVNGQRVVEDAFFERMIGPSPNSDWYGYQIWLGYSREPNPRSELLAGGYQRQDPFIADDAYYASGFGAQRVYVVPSAQLVIVRMGPSGGRKPVKETWDNSFLVNTAIGGLIPKKIEMIEN